MQLACQALAFFRACREHNAPDRAEDEELGRLCCSLRLGAQQIQAYSTVDIDTRGYRHRYRYRYTYRHTVQ